MGGAGRDDAGVDGDGGAGSGDGGDGGGEGARHSHVTAGQSRGEARQPSRLDSHAVCAQYSPAPGSDAYAAVGRQ